MVIDHFDKIRASYKMPRIFAFTTGTFPVQFSLRFSQHSGPCSPSKSLRPLFWETFLRPAHLRQLPAKRSSTQVSAVLRSKLVGYRRRVAHHAGKLVRTYSRASFQAMPLDECRHHHSSSTPDNKATYSIFLRAGSCGSTFFTWRTGVTIPLTSLPQIIPHGEEVAH